MNGGEIASVAEFYVLDEAGKRLSREPWTVAYVDSEDTDGVNRTADKIFDLQESTYWSTATGAAYPHAVVIDLGSEQTVGGIQYLPRMEAGVPGAIKDFRIYVKGERF